MMQRKKIKSLSVFLAAVSAAVFIPLTANAADENYIHHQDTGPIIISADDQNHKDNPAPCTHLIDQTPDSITVQSGTHKIILKDISIDLSGSDVAGLCAFSLGDTANVTLTLEGNNTLKSSDGMSGINVPRGAKLTINEAEGKPGSLTVEGGKGGAGIGSFGSSILGAGDITIESGTINAKGGNYCAGIGGNQNGNGGNITITGGKVTATGGLDAPGIGGGYNTKNSGNVTITNITGTVTANGGQSSNSTYKPDGINCAVLSSKSANGMTNSVTIHSNSSISAGFKGDFNGLIWSGNDGYVYGNATLTEDIDVDESIYIPPNATLFIPDTPKLINKGLIYGSGTILNANKLVTIPTKPGLGIDGPSEEVVLKAEHIHPNESLVYTGSNLFSKAVTFDEYDKDGFRIEKVSNWTPSIYLGGKLVTEMVGAGNYTISYKKQGYHDIDIPVEVKAKELTLDMVTPRQIPDQEYNWGNKIVPKLTVKYGKETLEQGKDYILSCTDNEAVGTATLSIEGTTNNSNYCTATEDSDHITTFKIVPLSLKNAVITLGNTDDLIYDGTEHIPDIEVTFKKSTTSGGNTTDELFVLPEDEYDIEYSREDFTEEDYLDEDGKELSATELEKKMLTQAGTVTVTIKAVQIEGEEANYSGEQSTTFKIAKAPLTIASVTAKDRPYDGSKYVEIDKVEFESPGLIGDDEVGIKTKALLTVTPDPDDPEDEGTVANVGTYTEVTFDVTEIELSGKDARNYTVAVPEGPLNLENKFLTQKIEISKKVPEKTEITGKKSANTDETKFNFTVQFVPEDGVEYLFGMDNESAEEVWRSGGTLVDVEAEDGTMQKVMQFTYENIEPGTPHLFHVHSKATKNVEGKTIGSVDDDFKQIDRPEDHIPQKVELSFSLNDDKATFTATIVPTPSIAGLEYSFDREGGADTFSSAEGANQISDCLPTKEYVGWVRYPETAVYKAGKPVSVTANAPKVEEQERVIPNLEWIDKNEPDENLVPDSLKANEELNNMESIIAKMTRILSALPGYTYEDMAFYDLTISIEKIHSDGEIETVTDLSEYVNKGGIKITVPYPEGTNKDTNDFVVAHMFSTEAGRFHPGDVETPSVSKGDDGLTFTVQSTSPLAIAWKAATQNDPNGTDDPTTDDPNAEDPNGTDDPNAEDPNGTDDPNAEDPNSGLDPLANTGNGSDNNGNGSDANGANGSGANQSAADALANAAKSLLPKTGDTNKIIMWIVIAAACIVVIVVVRVRSKNANKPKKAGTVNKTSSSKQTNKSNTINKSKK